MEKIINTYDKDEKTFHIGNKQLLITPAEFDIIMGIASGHKNIDMKDTQVSPNSLLKRKFDGIRLVKPQHLKTQLLKSMISPELVDIYDTVRIIILHVMSCLLFVSSSAVARVWMFQIYENIEELCNCNWGQSVLDYLMKYVHTKNAQYVKGSTTFLQVSHTTTFP